MTSQRGLRIQLPVTNFQFYGNLSLGSDAFPISALEIMVFPRTISSHFAVLNTLFIQTPFEPPLYFQSAYPAP